jgi:hypothetical protein
MALHRFGTWRTAPPQAGPFVCATLDHLVKTWNSNSPKCLIKNS